MELAATGRLIAFEEAQEYRLIEDIFEGEDFFPQVLDYARQFVAPNKPSKAVGLIKRAIQTGLQGSQYEGLAFERELLAQAFASVDAAEGLAAYSWRRLRLRGNKLKGAGRKRRHRRKAARSSGTDYRHTIFYLCFAVAGIQFWNRYNRVSPAHGGQSAPAVSFRGNRP